MILGLSTAKRSLPLQLLLFAVSVFVPALICMAVLLFANVSEGRRARQQELLATARAASASIDQSLGRSLATSEALATSTAVLAEDWPAAKARALRLKPDSAVWIVLSDDDRRQLFNTNPLAKPTRPAAKIPENYLRAKATGRPQISDLFKGQATGLPLVAIDAPVPHPGGVRILSIIIDPVSFQRGFTALPKGAFVAVVDRKHEVVVRSRLNDKFVGKRATDEVSAAISRSAEGVITTRSLEGAPSVVAFTHSALSGWTTMVVAPRRTFEAPLYANLIAFGVVSLLAAGLSFTGAYLYSRTIAGDLRLLQEDAVAVGRGQIVKPRPGLISNFEEVQAALSDASQELSLRSDRQRLMINELNHRVKNTLSTVQSLAAQSFRSDAPDAAEQFEQRLTTLAAAHDLLTKTGWEPVEMADIVARRDQGHEDAISAEGPPVTVPPQAALGLCMCLHELTTNSIKYGALSRPEGRVSITWSLGSETELLLVWRERGGPPPGPITPGFGARLIDRLMRHELHGAAHRSFEPEGLVFSARVSLAEQSRWQNVF